MQALRRIRRALPAITLATAAATVLVGIASASPRLQVTIDSGPSRTVQDTAAAFAFSANEPASFRCSLDGSPPAPCRSPQSYAGLGLGSHRFEVEASNRDRAGNLFVDREARSWTIELPPGPTPDPPPPADPLPPGEGADLDGDAVPARNDACPGTAAGKPSLWRGCTAGDLVREADVLIRPVLGQLGEASRLLDRERGLGKPRRQIGRARRLAAAAAGLLEAGKPCRASSVYADALGQVGRAKAGMRGTLLARRRVAIRGLGPAPDVSTRAMAIAMFDVKRALLAEALGEAGGMRAIFTRACNALGRRFAVRGRVLETDDAAGIVRLVGGALLVLPRELRSRGEVGEGARVRATGFKLGGDTTLAGTLTSAAGTGYPGVKKVSCVALRIAPAQPFPPHAVPSGPAKLHHPAAYRAESGVHVLETLSQVGVVRTGCPDLVSGGKVLRYSARIRESLGAKHADLALDLEPGETVEIGSVVPTGKTATLTVTTLVEACKQLANGVDICDPVTKLATESIKFKLVAYGSLASVQYADTSFGVKDNDLTGDYEYAQAVSIKTNGMAAGATGFQASGYQEEQGTSSRPQTRLVELGEQFLIYADDFGSGDLFDLYSTGTNRSSGLMWPHVVGKRNGWTFWYAAALPSIVRDRIHQCVLAVSLAVPKGPPNPEGGFYPPSSLFFPMSVKDSYYRLPFQAGLNPATGLMNIDDPHPPGRHPEGQAYAFDLGAPEGTPLLAARSGTVKLMEDQDPYNSADPDKPDDWPKIGNFIWLKHEDGTFATYFHNKKGSADVNVGDEVRRGEKIAKVGDTGQASGPHVHFGAFNKAGFDFTDFSDVVGDVRIRFEAMVGGANDFDPCYIPRNLASGVTFYSTNELPLGD
jgi:hypothetical protein